jgi:hypothetical protein
VKSCVYVCKRYVKVVCKVLLSFFVFCVWQSCVESGRLVYSCV